MSDLFRVRERILNILPESRGNLHDQIDENRSFSPRLIADSGNLEGLRTNNVCDQHKSSGLSFFAFNLYFTVLQKRIKKSEEPVSNMHN